MKDLTQFKKELKERKLKEIEKNNVIEKMIDKAEFFDTDLLTKWDKLVNEQFDYGRGYKPHYIMHPHCPNCKTEMNKAVAARTRTKNNQIMMCEKVIFSCLSCGYECAERDDL